MGTGEESTPTKSSKPASSAQETPITPTTPAYPDWSSSMQAFYGAGATPPFFASTVASPTPHPYLWGSQHPLMPPYGTPVPYPALYPPGGVYAHPNMATAECEELQHRVETLSNENHTLRDELQRLSEECEKLTSENNSIKEELTKLCGPDVLSKLENSNGTHLQSRGDEDHTLGKGVVWALLLIWEFLLSAFPRRGILCSLLAPVGAATKRAFFLLLAPRFSVHVIL
ncbi:UNVERIFIED_CONTAM: G-box-binding factor 1 [Sesamum radiatum]|uniref:G-box-binding factor 1 n=1 Tax=Sesamum radiatum TaxID=300843 RepID=A0AAW2VP28_SESRA